jgi:RNA polymerase sigma-70 factor (ECF subfamily)
MVAEDKIREHLERRDFAAAATAAIQAYGPEVLGYLVAVMRNQQDAEDVFGQFSEDLWKGLPEFRGAASLRTWAYRIAWHAAMRFRRGAARRPVTRLETAEISRIVLKARTTTLRRTTVVRAELARLRESLGPDDQTLLILRLDRGLSWSDVASVLSQPEEPLDAATVRKRFERLKVKLRAIAKATGLSRD